MDYQQEVKTLEEYQTTNWFKPRVGKYKIKIVTEPKPTEYKDDDGNITPQIELDITVNDEVFKWTVGKGKTLSSLYGQLMKVGSKNGKLAGEEITLIVKSDGKKNDYFVPEAA